MQSSAAAASAALGLGQCDFLLSAAATACSGDTSDIGLPDSCAAFFHAALLRK
jgi:hypothetical protein|eukprot:COSAG06_NODE_187_length_20790_cov_46.433232_7_plen_53_part_00